MLKHSWLCPNRTLKCSPAFLRVVLAISCTVFPGCASLGVVPDRFDSDFKEAAEGTCIEQHGKAEGGKRVPNYSDNNYLACLEYEKAVQWGNELQEAYRARSSMNRYAIWTSGAIALGAVGSLAGLAAFSLAGSDAAKIIPLATGFVGGLFGLAQNSGKADAYTKATGDISNGLKMADGRIQQTGRNEESYRTATRVLLASIYDSQINLDKAKIELTPNEQKLSSEAERLQEKIDKLEAEKAFKSLEVNTVTLETNDKMKITFKGKANLSDLQFSDIDIQVSGEKAIVVGDWSKEFVAGIPEAIKGNTGNYPVQVLIKGHSIQPIKNLTIP